MDQVWQTILFILAVYWIYTTVDEYLGPIARAARDRIVYWITPPPKPNPDPNHKDRAARTTGGTGVTVEADPVCGVCGETYQRLCHYPHEHTGYCVDIDDIRDLPCGHYAHKECQKSGDPCMHDHPTPQEQPDA